MTAINVCNHCPAGRRARRPATVTLQGALGSDTAVTWAPVAGASGYRVHWRRNDAQDWRSIAICPQHAATTTLKNVIVDDTFIGVSALARTAAQSIVTFGGGSSATAGRSDRAGDGRPVVATCLDLEAEPDPVAATEEIVDRRGAERRAAAGDRFRIAIEQFLDRGEQRHRAAADLTS